MRYTLTFARARAVVAAAVVLGRQSIPRLFTNLPAVVDATSALLPIFALSLPGDGINAVLQGLLRGGVGLHSWRGGLQ